MAVAEEGDRPIVSRLHTVWWCRHAEPGGASPRCPGVAGREVAGQGVRSKLTPVRMARILVIDDNDLVCGFLKATLQDAGYDVLVAGDGEQGLRQFAERAIDLVICDVLMPNKDGLETVREIRGINGTLPIITINGGPAVDRTVLDSGEIDYLRLALAFGATHAIAKPFRPGELIALVRMCLDAAETRRS
jgi:DNA-binding response OmpR family regulator